MLQEPTVEKLHAMRLGAIAAAWEEQNKLASVDGLEVMEDRYGDRSTIVTSQLPLKQWHEWIGDPTLADAILDRLVHNAYKIELQGPYLRKENAAR